jgi:hypothetical protein
MALNVRGGDVSRSKYAREQRSGTAESGSRLAGRIRADAISDPSAQRHTPACFETPYRTPAKNTLWSSLPALESCG